MARTRCQGVSVGLRDGNGIASKGIFTWVQVRTAWPFLIAGSKRHCRTAATAVSVKGPRARSTTMLTGTPVSDTRTRDNYAADSRKFLRCITRIHDRNRTRATDRDAVN